MTENKAPASGSILVVGGGINGLAVAYELAVLGVKNVVVLEKRYIGSGSTGRCGGGIRQLWTTEENIRLAQEMHILPALGQSLYDDLTTKVGAGTISGNDETLMESYIASYGCPPMLAMRITCPDRSWSRPA